VRGRAEGDGTARAVLASLAPVGEDPFGSRSASYVGSMIIASVIGAGIIGGGDSEARSLIFLEMGYA